MNQQSYVTAVLVFALLVGWGTAANAEPAATSTTAAGRGTLEGTIRYEGDAKRPWRYVRYYVKQGIAGELSETLVALRGKNLRGSDSAPAAKTVRVDQKNFQFSPELTAIRVGDTVNFTNRDQTVHNVQATSEIANFNVTMAADGEHPVKFDKAGGTRQYVRVGCVFHSSMRAWVFVFDHPYFVTTAADGKYRLANVPPGEYDLEVLHPAGGLRSKKSVVVKANETQKIDVRLTPDHKEAP